MTDGVADRCIINTDHKDTASSLSSAADADTASASPAAVALENTLQRFGEMRSGRNVLLTVNRKRRHDDDHRPMITFIPQDRSNLPMKRPRSVSSLSSSMSSLSSSSTTTSSCFDMSSFSEASQQVEDSLWFPSIEWPSSPRSILPTSDDNDDSDDAENDDRSEASEDDCISRIGRSSNSCNIAATTTTTTSTTSAATTTTTTTTQNDNSTRCPLDRRLCCRRGLVRSSRSIDLASWNCLSTATTTIIDGQKA